ncbi:MAG TPA: D-alanyl-D-alanine carboxypeptidase/D-alanyl-D-alanine-endopeptidase [Mycobacteriales bacterium]
MARRARGHVQSLPARFRALPARDRRRTVAGAAVVLTVAALVGGGSAAQDGQHAAGSAHARGGSATTSLALPPPPPPVLVADQAGGTQPVADRVAAALAGPMGADTLGERVSARVVDLATGDVLFDHGGDRMATPASTTKITTAVALLGVMSPDQRITTTVVAGDRPGQVVLVGAGDPTLSAAPPGRPTAYQGAARLSDLAHQVAAQAAQASGVGTSGTSGAAVTQVVVDQSLFTGPTVHPTWDPTDVDGGYVAPIEALMADGGREHPDSGTRSHQPALDAGRAFASFLGLPASAVVTGSAPTDAQVLAQVRSAPIIRIVEQMLTVSDNVLAECLARQVAIARGAAASFDGATQAIRDELADLGVDVSGEGLVDGSGLSPQDRLSPALLVNVLRMAASPAHPVLHALFPGLPVAGYEGTLADRYRTGPPAEFAGMVRAKTGTLSGVSTLSGVVQDADGRTLAFAFMADQVPPGGTLAAEAALDRLAGSLARCGCS